MLVGRGYGIGDLKACTFRQLTALAEIAGKREPLH